MWLKYSKSVIYLLWGDEENMWLYVGGVIYDDGNIKEGNRIKDVK